MRDLTRLDATILSRSAIGGQPFEYKGHTFACTEQGNPIVDGRTYEDGDWERAFRDFEKVVFPETVCPKCGGRRLPDVSDPSEYGYMKCQDCGDRTKEFEK